MFNRRHAARLYQVEAYLCIGAGISGPTPFLRYAAGIQLDLIRGEMD